MPDIEQVIVFRHCTRMYANLRRRYAACAAKKLTECARESQRWEENLNWQIQGCTVVASHLDNLHATVGKPLHLDKTKWNVHNFRSVSSQTAELPRCASSLPRPRKRKRGGKKFARGSFANTELTRTCSLTPPSNRLSFTTRGVRRGYHACGFAITAITPCGFAWCFAWGVCLSCRLYRAVSSGLQQRIA